MIPVSLHNTCSSHSFLALLDSGEDGNFISPEVVHSYRKRYRIPDLLILLPLMVHLYLEEELHLLQSQFSPKCEEDHTEVLSFLALPQNSYAIVLGLP